MHVTIEINGRQALPVRAIPLLTDWMGLSPDQLAQILAGDSDHWPSFDGLGAHRLHADGSTEPVPPRRWASWVVGKLQATSDAIKAKQTSHETGYQQWRRESLAQLPAGVFVWRDEFEAAHADEYGPEGMRARGNPEGFDPAPHALDFNPQPDPAIAPPSLVLEGFGQNLHQEYHDAFAQWCEVDAIDRQVRELETTQPVGVTEILARRAGLKELHVERARLLAVLEGKEPPTPTPVEPPLNEAPTPATAPVEPLPALPVKETPAERRARWLAMFDEEKKREKRGALQRLADREGVDRSNMGKDIAKARLARDTQRRSGSWTSQLVQDGKHTH